MIKVVLLEELLDNKGKWGRTVQTRESSEYENYGIQKNRDSRGISYWADDVIQYRTGDGKSWGIIFHSSAFNKYIGNLDDLKQ